MTDFRKAAEEWRNGPERTVCDTTDRVTPNPSTPAPAASPATEEEFPLTITMNEKQWAEFQMLLDDPPVPTPALIELMKRTAPWSATAGVERSASAASPQCTCDPPSGSFECEVHYPRPQQTERLGPCLVCEGTDAEYDIFGCGSLRDCPIRNRRSTPPQPAAQQKGEIERLKEEISLSRTFERQYLDDKETAERERDEARRELAEANALVTQLAQASDDSGEENATLRSLSTPTPETST